MTAESTTDRRQVLVTGGSGFIGHHLVEALLRGGDGVTVLSRTPARTQARLPAGTRVLRSLDELDDGARIDAIVNLAGAQILGTPWTAARRNTLRDSRLHTTRALVALCARLHRRPGVFISASAIGYYGIGGGAPGDETAAPQSIFQSHLCSDWESAAFEAATAGTRVAVLRFGIVLGRDGGALPALALPVRLGLGTVLGDGRQPLPWIHLSDALGLISQALDGESFSGPVNAVSPQAVTQREFVAALGRVLHRPVLFRVPAFILRTLLGEMSQLLLDGRPVKPAAALAAGYPFRFADLDAALTNLLGRRTPTSDLD